MGAVKKLLEKKVLRDLIPLNALSAIHLDEISRKAVIEEVRSGRYAFKKGDRDYQSVYLIEGKIELLDDGREIVGTVVAGSEAARHPLAHRQPRQLSARAAGAVTVARIDSSLLDVLLTWDESSGYDVVEIDAEENDDWMTRMLQSQAFLQLPPSNIHQLLMRLEEVALSAGDTVVRQGDAGDYFYIVKSGRLAVSRKASQRSKEVVLAELGEGACFGEEALVAGTARNASVTMITDGTLMRLSKEDFDELLCASMVREVEFPEAERLVAQGARWLDVRLPGEFENQAIRDSINLPLSALRDQSADLDSTVSYVLCCDTGRRSAAGAFVLGQRGFSVHVLKNGLGEAPDAALTGVQADTAPAGQSQDAEIIPFGADAGSDTETQQPASAQGQAGNDVDDADGVSVQELEKLKKQLSETQSRLQETEAQRAEEQAISARVIQQIDTLEKELQRALEERAEVEQKLGEQQAEKRSVDGELAEVTGRQDAERREHEKRIRMLEQELAQVSEDYKQLGQRAGALAGERDSAASELQRVSSQLAALQEQLASAQSESSGQIDALQGSLEEQSKALQHEQDQQRALQQQVADLESARTRLEQQLADASTRERELQQRLQQAEQETANALEEARSDASGAQETLNRRITDLEAELEAQRQLLESKQSQGEELEGKLGAAEEALTEVSAREQELQQRLQQAEQEAASALEVARSDASGAQETLNRRITELETELETHRRQLETRQARCEELDHKLGEVEQTLREASEAEQQAREQSRAAEENASGGQQELERVKGESEDLRRELEESRRQHAEADQRIAELEKRLADSTREHESDITSVRDALGRAQDERENVKRDQKRLMESLRQVERKLEQERQDHEDEVHRLRKELKQAAGESSAGLAAELEALQQQLKQGVHDRDELEIKLGQRSAQLENAQAETAKLTKQLEQARDSARQAEQQLIESTQAANEEMTIRLAAEQEIQESLREDLKKSVGDRDEQQRQLESLGHEVERLREALESERVKLEGKEQAERQVTELLEKVQQTQRERDAALGAQQQSQQEADELRAAAEVSRGLGDMATAGADEEALRAELEEARASADRAMRERAEAQEQGLLLQQEVEHLGAELRELRSGGTADGQAAQIPSLDANDPDAASILQSDFGEPQPSVDSAPAEAVLLDTDVGEQGAVDRAAGGATRGVKGFLLGLIVVVALAAAGGFWWLQRQPASEALEVSDSAASNQMIQPAEQGAQDDDAVSADSVEAATPKNRVPAFARGMPDIPRPTVADAEVAGREAEAVRESETTPAPDKQGLDTSSSSESQAPVVKQPGKTFRDTLSAGGSGPSMVELRADGFEMGSGPASPNFDERPRHEVNLRRFAISKYEVTFKQYDRFSEHTGRARPRAAGRARGTRPVVNVSWQDAVAYTEWLSSQTGHRYRLPTEAEWEFAARSGSATRFWWGNQVGDSHANCFDCGTKWAGRETAPVGSFAASDFGLHDMAGNAREWVRDCYAANYRGAPADGSAVESSACPERVIRGGGYASPSAKLRSAARDRAAADARLDDLGFRVVREY